MFEEEKSRGFGIRREYEKGNVQNGRELGSSLRSHSRGI